MQTTVANAGGVYCNHQSQRLQQKGIDGNCEAASETLFK